MEHQKEISTTNHTKINLKQMKILNAAINAAHEVLKLVPELKFKITLTEI